MLEPQIVFVSSGDVILKTWSYHSRHWSILCSDAARPNNNERLWFCSYWEIRMSGIGEGSSLLSDEGDSWQEQVPFGFSSPTNKRDFLTALLRLSGFSLSLGGCFSCITGSELFQNVCKKWFTVSSGADGCRWTGSCFSEVEPVKEKCHA